MRRLWVYVIVLGAGALGAAGAIYYDYHQRERLFFERTACVGSMIRLNLSKEIYAMEHHLTNGAVIPDDALWPEYGKVEECLSGGHYSLNVVGMYRSCSYTGVVRWKGRLWRHEYPPREAGGGWVK